MVRPIAESKKGYIFLQDTETGEVTINERHFNEYKKLRTLTKEQFEQLQQTTEYKRKVKPITVESKQKMKHDAVNTYPKGGKVPKEQPMSLSPIAALNPTNFPLKTESQNGSTQSEPAEAPTGELQVQNSEASPSPAPTEDNQTREGVESISL